MSDLPLFPLNTVLFPGTPLRLHIFEERYKQMIKLCLEKQQAFGVVLIKSGAEASGPLAEPYAIGTFANIIKVQTLADERMNIVVIGGDRFQIVSLDNTSQPYLVGNLEPYPLLSKDPQSLAQLSLRLNQWLRNFAAVISETSNIQIDIEELTDDSVHLAFLSASMLPLPIEQKQAILSAETAETLMEMMINIARNEIALLKAVGMKSASTQGLFSIN